MSPHLREQPGVADVPDTAAENGEPAVQPRAEDDPWFSLIEDAADIIIEKLPPVVEIVEGIVTEHSKLLIVSGAKCFKTWHTMDLALSISHGVPFLGQKTTRQRILYVNLELKTQTFKRRLQTITEAIAKAKGITIDRAWFRLLPLRGKIADVPVPLLISRIIRIAQHFNATVVIIDPIYKLNTEGEENSTRAQTILFNQLDRFTTEAACAVVLCDHFSKGNQSEKDPLDTPRGSSAKAGDVDSMMVLRKHEVEGCYRVDVIHRELPPVEPYCIGWKHPLMVLRPDLSPDAMKKARGGRNKAHDPEKLCAAIADATVENPVSISEWAKAAKITRQTLQGYVPELRAKGLIATTGEGGKARQYLTEKGQLAAKRAKEKA